MNYKNITLLLTSILMLAGCSDNAIQQTESKVVEKTAIVEVKEIPKVVVTQIKDYTIDEIYNQMCIECHSSDGSGNTEKLTPSMKNLSQQEMLTELKNVENDKGHIIMEHNREQILKKGMEYSAEDMAIYMYERFNK